jgi:hypothetical protein
MRSANTPFTSTNKVAGPKGHDLPNWQEATACLYANIPPYRSRHRIQDFVAALVISPGRDASMISPPTKPSNRRKRI